VGYTDDSSVESDFGQLARRMDRWSKDRTVNSGSFNEKLSSTLNKVNYNTLLESLKCIARFKTTELPPIPELERRQTMLLRSLLAHDVYTKVFKNPFSCMGSGEPNLS
jgi:hypothetical protein